MKVKAFKSPQIVIPTQLMIEEENESDAGGNTVHDQKSLMDEYLTFDLAGVSSSHMYQYYCQLCCH